MSKVKIGDITESCLGKMLDAEKNKGEYYPYLANINVRWGRFDLENLPLMRFEEDEHERYGLKKGDLVMCEGGEPGRCAIWKDEIPNMKIQKALHRIRAKEDLLDIRYLYYWFLIAGKQKLLKGFLTETTIKHLSGDKLKEIEIELPALEEQRKIADILSALDEKIDCNERIIEVLSKEIETLYNFWFHQFEFSNEEGKPYRSSKGEMVWCDELKKEIPKGWSFGELKDIANITMGQSPNGDSYNDSGNGMIFFQGKTDYGLRFPMPRMYTTNPTRFAKKNDILLSVRAPVGALNIAIEDCCIGRGLAALNSKLGSNMHLYYTLLNFQPLFEVFDGNGTTFGALTKDVLFGMHTVIPDLGVVQKFEDIVSPLDRKIVSCEKENRQLSAMRDWLLPLLMNGQATIK